MPDLSQLAERITVPQLLFLAGVILAVMAMMRLARLRATRREPEHSRADLLAQLRPPIEHERLAPARAAVPASSNAPTEELLRRLENRVKALEELLRAADRRIVELNALLHRPAARHASPRITRRNRSKRVRELAQGAKSVERRDPARLADRYQAVYRLLDQGDSAALVAKKLGYPIGEVELIAGLRG